MAAKVMCVAYHRDAGEPMAGRVRWCALEPGTELDPGAAYDQTLCGGSISFRVGSEVRLPTCADCLTLLSSQSAQGEAQKPPEEPEPCGHVHAYKAVPVAWWCPECGALCPTAERARGRPAAASFRVPNGPWAKHRRKSRKRRR